MPLARGGIYHHHVLISRFTFTDFDDVIDSHTLLLDYFTGELTDYA